jgi:O-antigen/teichoic acid export membrane protein
MLTQFTVWLALADGSLAYATQQVLSKQYINEKDFHEHLTAALLFRVFLGLASGFGYFLVISLQFPSLIFPTGLLAFNILVYAIGTSSLGIWAAKQDFRVESYSSIIGSLFFVIPAFLVTFVTDSIAGILACYLLGTFVSSTYIFSRTTRRWNYRQVSLSRIREIFMQYLPICLPVTISAFMFFLYFRGDMMFVAGENGSETAGVYGIALLIFFLVVDIIWSQFGKAYTPRLLNHWHERYKIMETVLRELNTILDIYSFIGIVLITGVAILARPIFSIIFGEQSPWVNAAPPLFWLLTGFISTIGYSLVSRLIMVEGKNTKAMILGSIIIGTKVIFLWILPELNIKKVSIITSVGMVVLFLSTTVLLDQMGRRLIIEWTSLIRLFLPTINAGIIIHIYEVYSMDESILYSFLALNLLMAAFISRNGLIDGLSKIRRQFSSI